MVEVNALLLNVSGWRTRDGDDARNFCVSLKVAVLARQLRQRPFKDQRSTFSYNALSSITTFVEPLCG